MLDLASLMKYVLEGLAVAAAAFFIPRRNINLQEVAMIALTAAAVFAVLDLFAPSVASGARQGSGFGIGMNLVGGDGEAAVNDSVESEGDTDSSAESSDDDSSTEDSDSNDDSGVNANGESTTETFTSQPAPLDYQ